MARWKVNYKTQVVYGGHLYGPGETFEASDGEVLAEGFGSYVTKMKAQQSSLNKAQQSSLNKSK